ncbi:MAG: hypothetical protein PHR81_01380 [Bacteroidales bacterium]|jgi:hypothetical protein|nr:hypothetical protein [Bacteroidales bacterium]MDD4213440.1 hypothetical protein [Bacteroidales bacterium]
MKNNNINTQSINIDNFINRMQREDKRNRKLMRGMFFVYLACTIFYAALFIINPDPEISGVDRISGAFYVLAFLIGTWFFRWQYKTYKNLDYTLPLFNVLKKTEERYRFFNKRWYPVFIVVILISVGITLNAYEHHKYFEAEPLTKILVIQAVYWGIMFISGLIGYFFWRKRSMPIWRGAKNLLEELKS